MTPDPLFTTVEDKERFLAATDLVRSTGVAGLEIRHSPEDEPPIIWSCVASWFVGKGGQPISETQAKAASPLKPPRTAFEVGSSMVGPVEALHRLVAEVIDSGHCAQCQRPSAVDWTGTELAGVLMSETNEHGTTVDPLCIIAWAPRRQGVRGQFVRACDGKTYRAGSGA